MPSSLMGLFSSRVYPAAAAAAAAAGGRSRILVSLTASLNNHFIHRKTDAPSSSISPSYVSSHCAGIHTKSISGESPPPPPPHARTRTTSSPWLMLPPQFVAGDMIYKFYSLADEKVLSFNKRRGGGGGGPDDNAYLVGSSHGWLIYVNRSDKNMFLTYPISGRHVKLPSLHTLPPPIPKKNKVSNVIISSSSPDGNDDQHHCRAVMGCRDGVLAYCVPGRSSKWTRLSGLTYESFVYSAKQKLFFALNEGDQEVEAWHLIDPKHSVYAAKRKLYIDVDGKAYSASKEFDVAKIWMRQFLVTTEYSDDLFAVSQYIMERMGPDGLPVVPLTAFSDDDDDVPDRTVGFDVHKYDPVGRVFKYIDPTRGGPPHKYDPEIKALKYGGGGGGGSSLEGLAFFIGANHGFALRADEYPGLKPNSIYFTCTGKNAPLNNFNYGEHDVGIFNYEDGTFSSCYYPRDYGSIKHINISNMVHSKPRRRRTLI
ncbi:PREDICTED: uncharacterized protein LOC105955851 [Erythranthe guttata]|uniref:uncharacterized protein LOC105955851 n=1 Tax=Erythranthe guttata TaxID=4155 RepID=UPI00064D7F3D|nr:PREDICTED: uncharacterized protein LOC105955851 [Erythranthe guttata]|eukprot:XP_012835108.1 PREDICTED: uncharacterized protein LOC105955851 [Erythranthe guttata]